ncbi:MAG: NYN domain-containing protein [Candidatus Omnitrophica bacterium]|nr:NYN domain-containing protein [Candidatus Omnitrophota bacterium]
MEQVALFIDVDNLSIPVRQEGGDINWDILLGSIKKQINTETRLDFAKAYFDVGNKNNSDYCRLLYDRGIEAVYAPVFSFKDALTGQIKNKSLSDPMMICDIISILYEKAEINNFVIVTSDKDFVPVVRMLVKKNKNVMVVGIKKNGYYLSEECKKLNIPFIDYLAET